MIDIKVTRTGQEKIAAQLKKIKNAPQKVLVEVGKMEVKNTKERIRSTKTAPDGSVWKPWSFATWKERKRTGTLAGGLLNRTGALLNSIVFNITRGKVTIYSTKKYGEYLQQGTPRMPPRPFLGWSKAALNKIKELFKSEIQ